MQKEQTSAEKFRKKQKTTDHLPPAVSRETRKIMESVVFPKASAPRKPAHKKGMKGDQGINL